MLNFLAMNDNIFLDGVRTICATFDKAVYSIISFVYEIILGVANIEVFNQDVVSDFSGRLYTLIGIFMLFKVSFSIINYIILPDTIIDKERGGGKLIKNIVITFVLIIVMPTIFNLMGRAQSAILNDHVIENFILGTDGETAGNKFKISEKCTNDPVVINNMGDYVALVVFRPFFQVDEEGANPQDLVNPTGFYCNATSINNLLKISVYNSPNTLSSGFSISGNYNVDYWFIISTLVGGVVALFLINFAMDVAVRAIKLSFLQIISPIPIISFIDPNQAKSGMFKKWTQELLKTWADLFIKLIALYFVIKIISMLDGISETIGATEHKFWIEILVIIGGLIFAKKLPSLIGNMLGIKIDGGFNINPLKKLEKEALGGKFLAKVPAAAGGLALGGVGAIMGHNLAKNKFKQNMSEHSQKLDAYNASVSQRLQNAQTEAERQKIIDEGRNLRQKLDDEVKSYYSKFSNNHAIAAGFAETIRGAKHGFKKGGTTPKEIINNSVSAAKSAAEDKNRSDIMTFRRRVEDFKTDISGVKNDSGTTSEINRDIKETNENLTDIRNYIAQLNHSFAALPAGAISYNRDSNGNMQPTASSTFDYDAHGITRADVENMISDLRGLREDEKRANRRLAELNSAKDANKKS